MTTGRGIDHIGIASRDLDGLAARYEALGFTLTPRAYHQDHMGTSNRLVQFEGRNFIELLEVDRPRTMLPHGPGFMGFGQFNHDYLNAREGMSLVIFRTDDAAADLAAWAAKGLDVYDQFNFERQATLPDGSEATVRFELGFVTHPDINVLFYVCDNKAEEHFWKPDYQRHANGALGIQSVVIASENKTRDAVFISKLFDAEILPGCAEGLRVSCGPEHEALIVSPEAVAERDPAWRGDLSQGSLAIGAALTVADGPRETTPSAEAGGVFLNWIA